MPRDRDDFDRKITPLQVLKDELCIYHARSKLRPLTPVPSISPSTLVAFSPVRNEIDRLPFFLEHYRKLGIDYFFFFDNGSEDGTIEFLAKQPDVCLYKAEQAFSLSNYGRHWFEILAESYLQENQWFVFVDTDELLIYPHHETVSLKQMAAYLDSQNDRAFKATMLDMYGVKFPPITADQPLWQTYPYFDRNFAKTYVVKPGIRSLYGGVRLRIFNLRAILNKSPLRKYQKKLRHAGVHWIDTIKPPSVEGVCLHFKFTSDFVEKAIQETERKQHWNGASEYRRYRDTMLANSKTDLYNPEHSVRFQGNDQLIEMGIMHTSATYEQFVANLEEKI